MATDISYYAVGLEYVIGLGLSFGLSFLLTYLSKRSLRDFLLYFAIFSSFGVWVGLLDIWVIFLNIIIIGVLTVIIIREKSGERV